MIQLKRSKRTVSVVAAHQAATYAGHLEASPLPRVVECVIEGNKEDARRIFGGLPIFVPQPELIPRPYPHPSLPDGIGVELPPVLTMLHLASEGLNSKRESAWEFVSELLVLLYSENGLLDEGLLAAQLPPLPWRRLAYEYSIMDF